MSQPVGRNRVAPPASPGKVLGFIGLAVSVLIIVLVYIAVSTGQTREIAEAYGRRRGNGAAESVNGTAVLAAMFEASGRKVNTITMLGQTAEKFDAIVWIPNSTRAPSADVEEFFERWLREGSNRTLVYIGRDYDASPKYWREVLKTIEPNRKAEYERRWAHAQARADAKSSAFPDNEQADWFTILSSPAPRKIDSLDGPWAAGVDVKQTELELAGRLDLPPATNGLSGNKFNAYNDYDENEVRVLLQSENDILAHSFERSYWTNSRVIVLANGSFTLNYPLVNKEHRKLAGKLISACPAQGNVAFLESDEFGPRVRKSESEGSAHALHLFTVWPISFIFIHFAALGIAYCIANFHIFGRPARLPKERRSDFGQHVAALGALLKKTRNVAYAESRVRTYLQQAKRASGKSHSRPAVSDQPTNQPNPNPSTPVSSTDTTPSAT